MKGLSYLKESNEIFERKIEENISSMIKNVMNTDSSLDQYDSSSDLSREKDESNMEIISFEGSFLTDNNTKNLINQIEKNEIIEIKNEEKSFDKESIDSINQNEFNYILDHSKRNISGIEGEILDNKSYNNSIDEDISNIPACKKSFFFSQKEKLNDKNLFIPRNFRNKRLSICSQTSSSSFLNPNSLTQDTLFSFDSERDNFNSWVDPVQSSLFKRKVFKTHKTDINTNKIYSDLLKTNYNMNNNFNNISCNMGSNSSTFLLNGNFNKENNLSLSSMKT